MRSMPLGDLLDLPVRRKLSALKASLRLHLAGRGLSLVIVALVAAVFFSFGVDRKLEMDIAQRAVILAAALIAAGYVAWRFLLRPLRVSMEAAELALVLENHYPQLNDRLISALEFSHARADSLGVSVALIREMARQANVVAADLRPADAVEGRPTWRRLGFAAGALVILTGFGALRARDMSFWFERNILFRDVPYPRQTELTVEVAPGLHVVRGGDLTVTVRADTQHVVPDKVVFHKKFPGVRPESETVEPLSEAREVFLKRFTGVTEPFEFRVAGGDYTSEWMEVHVVDPPELLELAFHVNYPEYMNRPSEAVTAEHGVVPVPPGSRIALAGQASKNLKSAFLILGDGPAVRAETFDVPVAAGGPEAPLGVRGALALPERIEAASLPLRIELTDTAGITNPAGAVYLLRIEPDNEPAVRMNPRSVSSDVSTRALIPLALQATDDHGIGDIELRVSITAPPSATTEPATSQPAAQPVEQFLSVAGLPKGEREVRAEHPVDLQPIELVVGQIVQVQATAVDTLPESFGGPNRSRRPATNTFRIVSDEDLLRELVRRQVEIREEFRQIVALQATARDRVRVVRDHLAGGGSIDAETVRKLNESAQDQGRIAAQCAVIAQRMQEILDEIVANRIGSPMQEAGLRDRIIGPLRQIAEKPMADMIVSISGASKMTDAAELRGFAAGSAEVLDGFHNRLEEILQHMQREQSRQELVAWLKRILGDSEEVDRIIQEHLDSQRGDIWEKGE